MLLYQENYMYWSNLVLFNSALIWIISSQCCLVHRTLEQKIGKMHISMFFTTSLLCKNTIHQIAVLWLPTLRLSLLSKIIVAKDPSPSIFVQQLQQCKVLKVQYIEHTSNGYTNITQLASICQKYSRIFSSFFYPSWVLKIHSVCLNILNYSFQYPKSCIMTEFLINKLSKTFSQHISILLVASSVSCWVCLTEPLKFEKLWWILSVIFFNDILLNLSRNSLKESETMKEQTLTF